MKKSAAGPPALKLIENPDIVSTLAHLNSGRPRLVVGFAAETENLVENARQKLLRKGCDLIVANSVAPGTTTFGGEFNAVQIVTRDRVEPWPQMGKLDVARRLVRLLAQSLDNHI